MNLETEATTQGEFYHACRLIDLQIALEVTSPVGRLDAIILSPDRKRVLAVIEVKDRHSNFRKGSTAQIQRYKRLGLPVYGLSKDNDPHRLAATIKQRHESDQGKTLGQIREMNYIREERLQQRREWRAKRIERQISALTNL